MISSRHLSTLGISTHHESLLRTSVKDNNNNKTNKKKVNELILYIKGHLTLKPIDDYNSHKISLRCLTRW